MSRKIAVITGAGSGVGRACALALVQRGYDTVLVGRNIKTLEETIDLAGAAPVQGKAIVCDVSNEKDVRALGERVRKELRDPSVLVNSAGINVAKRALADLSVADFKHILDVNLTGIFLMVHEFLPGMRKSGAG